jgi:hypothetical protein
MIQIENYKRKFSFLEKERDSSISEHSQMKVKNINLEKKLLQQKNEIERMKVENSTLLIEKKRLEEEMQNENEKIFEV